MRRIVVLLLLWPMVAGAGVYKWVDADGKVQFGEKPPADNRAQEVQIKAQPPAPDPSAGDRVRRLQHFSQVYEEEQAEKRAADEKAKQEAADRKRNCESARTRFQRIQRAGYLFNEDAQGKRVIASDAERKATEEEARRMVDQLCKPPR